jgi:hypothetical protein
MMAFSYVEPEVSGSLGPNTDLDSSVHPPIVKRLEFQFDGWLGDCLLESFPCFVITEPAKVAVENSGFSGVLFDDLAVSKSDQFDELYPDKGLPKFFWMKAVGRSGQDDFGLAKDFRLVLSDRALDVLRPLGLEQALISEYP